MKQEIMEQLETVERVDNEAAVPYPFDAENGSILGKFAAVEDLAEAYRNLQAEFTRKSQELSKLKNTVEEHKQGDAASANDKALCVVPEAVAAVVNKETAAGSALADKEGVYDGGKNLPAQMTDDAVSREEIIKNYLLSLAAAKASPAVIADKSGSFAFTDLGEARSLNDTEKLVKNFFETKR